MQLYLKHGGKHPHIVESKQGLKHFFFNEIYSEIKPLIVKHQLSDTTQRRIAKMTYNSAWEQYEKLTEEQQVRFYEMLWNDLEVKANQLQNHALLGYDIQEIEEESFNPSAVLVKRIPKPIKGLLIEVIAERTNEQGQKIYTDERGTEYTIMNNELYKLNEQLKGWIMINERWTLDFDKMSPQED
ncbi:hypothetical protein F400_gp135 [Bacillus phage BCD7]|uniref:Uncharacterized protein n=1 Tax=Bacillus phage BCD7 TaxID=1136534 RepID=J9PUE7_9CAUD|nr:hypothetical protein F400_gp135 [Bacillus phage BCD7]AEZ50582.1 hypothetical protein BCD7_0135 [Bacillus phage BCD7]